ncbi:unnamed protein product, partial [Iphiclides podalirius]
MADHSLLVLLATLVAAYGWTVFPLQNPQAYHYQRVQPTPVMRPVWPTPHFWIQNLPPLPEPSSLCEESSSRHEAITPSKVTKAVSSALLSTEINKIHLCDAILEQHCKRETGRQDQSQTCNQT